MVYTHRLVWSKIKSRERILWAFYVWCNQWMVCLSVNIALDKKKEKVCVRIYVSLHNIYILFNMNTDLAKVYMTKHEEEDDEFGYEKLLQTQSRVKEPWQGRASWFEPLSTKTACERLNGWQQISLWRRKRRSSSLLHKALFWCQLERRLLALMKGEKTVLPIAAESAWVGEVLGSEGASLIF